MNKATAEKVRDLIVDILENQLGYPLFVEAGPDFEVFVTEDFEDLAHVVLLYKSWSLRSEIHAPSFTFETLTDMHRLLHRKKAMLR